MYISFEHINVLCTVSDACHYVVTQIYLFFKYIYMILHHHAVEGYINFLYFGDTFS